MTRELVQEYIREYTDYLNKCLEEKGFSPDSFVSRTSLIALKRSGISIYKSTDTHIIGKNLLATYILDKKLMALTTECYLPLKVYFYDKEICGKDFYWNLPNKKYVDSIDFISTPFRFVDSWRSRFLYNYLLWGGFEFSHLFKDIFKTPGYEKLEWRIDSVGYSYPVTVNINGVQFSEEMNFYGVTPFKKTGKTDTYFIPDFLLI